MFQRSIPLFFTMAALAMAAVSSAQDRGRGSDHSDRSSHSSDRPSRSRATRSDDRSHEDRSDRHDTSRDARRTGSDDARPGRTGTSTAGGDSRSGRIGSDDSHSSGSGSRSGGDGRYSGGDSGRRNPLDYGGRGSGDRSDVRGGDRPQHDVASIGSPSRSYNRTPWHYDGRGRVEATHFGAPPTRAALNVDIHRGAPHSSVNVAVGGVYGGLRVGYVSYSGGGGYGGGGYGRGGYGGGGYGRGGSSFSLNVGFGYPYYAYDPYAPDVVVVASPWYRYSYLPPYIDHTHVVVVNDYPSTWAWNDWSVYDYDRDRDDVAAHDAIDDLQDSFERRSDRIADRLVPLEGDVAIYNDGKYDYSLNPDDFQKMFLDGIDQSKTVRYEIQEVRRRGDEIRIRARHTYEDSWGKEQSVIHEITLRREHGGDYVIREFGSE